jgi:hypothetical protein
MFEYFTDEECDFDFEAFMDDVMRDEDFEPALPFIAGLLPYGYDYFYGDEVYGLDAV